MCWEIGEGTYNVLYTKCQNETIDVYVIVTILSRVVVEGAQSHFISKKMILRFSLFAFDSV